LLIALIIVQILIKKQENSKASRLLIALIIALILIAARFGVKMQNLICKNKIKVE
jgi:hypothetical protein